VGGGAIKKTAVGKASEFSNMFTRNSATLMIFCAGPKCPKSTALHSRPHIWIQKIVPKKTGEGKRKKETDNFLQPAVQRIHNKSKY